MRYMLLFFGLAAATKTTDQKTADYNRKWGDWMGGLASRHALVAGTPFEARGSVVAADAVRDLELKPVDIGGFALIDAADDAEAIEIARDAPHIALGGTTIVRPLIANTRRTNAG
jgi:hypothetical protein